MRVVLNRKGNACRKKGTSSLATGQSCLNVLSPTPVWTPCDSTRCNTCDWYIPESPQKFEFSARSGFWECVRDFPGEWCMSFWWGREFKGQSGYVSCGIKNDQAPLWLSLVCCKILLDFQGRLFYQQICSSTTRISTPVERKFTSRGWKPGLPEESVENTLLTVHKKELNNAFITLLVVVSRLSSVSSKSNWSPPSKYLSAGVETAMQTTNRASNQIGIPSALWRVPA